MSSICADPVPQQPGRFTPTLTAMLVTIALTLWLVVIPLEFVAYERYGAIL
jgi:hypothetical protein